MSHGEAGHLHGNPRGVLPLLHKPRKQRVVTKDNNPGAKYEAVMKEGFRFKEEEGEVCDLLVRMAAVRRRRREPRTSRVGYRTDLATCRHGMGVWCREDTSTV